MTGGAWTLRYAWYRVVQAYQSGSAVMSELARKGYINEKGQAPSEELCAGRPPALFLLLNVMAALLFE